jgi:mycothiol synthase
MPFEIVPLTTDHAVEVRRLLADPSLAREFDTLLEAGQFDHVLHDRHAAPEALQLALEHGEPAGFTIGLVFPQASGPPRAMMRVAVGERFRRRGLGALLLERAARAFASREPRPGGLDIAAWMPSPEAEGFSARHGFTHVRWFWRMSRPPRPVPEPRWPAGVTFRTFDHSDAAFRDWSEIYNASFAEHWRYTPGTIELARTMAADPLFLADGLLLASREGRCVGFCRNDPLGRTGIVGTLGVAPEARGIGLGRAILRWAIGYFAARDYDRVALYVDGDNETALALYRTEGFEVDRTRRIWERAL